MLGHTPGPWILFLEYNTKGFQKIVGGHWGNINIAQVVKRQSMKDEDEANARLIAVAPELLRIVKTLLASWECDPDEDAQYEDLMDQAVGEAREAIAKVEGE